MPFTCLHGHAWLYPGLARSLPGGLHSCLALALAFQSFVWYFVYTFMLQPLVPHCNFGDVATVAHAASRSERESFLRCGDCSDLVALIIDMCNTSLPATESLKRWYYTFHDRTVTLSEHGCTCLSAQLLSAVDELLVDVVGIIF